MNQVTLNENVQARKKLFHSCGGLTGHQTTHFALLLAGYLCPITPESSLLECCTLDQGSSEHQLSKAFENKAV